MDDFGGGEEQCIIKVIIIHTYNCRNLFMKQSSLQYTHITHIIYI